MFEKQSRILGKFLSFNSKPTLQTFPELPECLTWMRFALAINYGIYLGLSYQTNEKGAIPLIMGLNFVTFAPMLYSAVILRADNDSYNGKLLFVGLPNAMALIFLIWIYYYTLGHEEEEETMKRLLIAAQQASSSSSTTDAGGEELNEAEEQATTTPMEESEF